MSGPTRPFPDSSFALIYEEFAIKEVYMPVAFKEDIYFNEYIFIDH